MHFEHCLYKCAFIVLLTNIWMVVEDSTLNYWKLMCTWDANVAMMQNGVGVTALVCIIFNNSITQESVVLVAIYTLSI